MSKDIGGSSDKIMCAISIMNSVMVEAVFNGRAIMRLVAQPRQAGHLQAKCFRFSNQVRKLYTWVICKSRNVGRRRKESSGQTRLKQNADKPDSECLRKMTAQW